MEIHSEESVIKKEIKEEDEVCFELVEVQSCSLEGVKKEIVSNEVEKIESCLDTIDSQSGFVTDGVKEENKMKQEMEDIEFKEEEINCEWTDPTEDKTDLLALYPTVEIKVKPKFTKDENTIPPDALPSTSREDGSESSNDVEKDSENDFSCPQFDSFQLEAPTNEVLNKELIGNKSFYKCKECDYICDSASHYKVHRMRHTGERPFKCNVCEYSSVTSSDIKRHSKVHMTLCSEKTYSCKQCELCFTNPTSLKIHSRSHAEKDPDSCKPYDYSSTKVYTGTKIEIKLYKCNECDYSCAQPGYLKRHMQKHTGYKPFKCKECNYACTTASRLNVHMKRHIGDKPYKCSLCEYSCVTSSDIKRHTLRHSGIKPYKCNECYFSCSKKSTLKVHMESHSGETA